MNVLAMFVACSVSFASSSAGEQAPARAVDARAQGTAADRLVREWEHALLLGRPAQVVRAGEQALGDEALARDGRVLALLARARADVSGDEPARALLEGARVGTATAGYVELELARLDLALDRLRDVERRLAAAPDDAAPVRFPELSDAWLLLGRARQRAGREGDAARLLRVFVERWPLHPEAPSAWHMLARAALLAGENDLARHCRERSASLGAWHGYYRARLVQIEEEPENALPRLGLAQLWSSVDQFGHARAALAEALELDPELARGWALLGELERRTEAPTRARAAYDRALELDAALHEVRYNRALLALGAGDVDAARADFQTLVDSNVADTPELRSTHLHLARILLRAGEDAAARARHARYRELGGTESLTPHGG